MVQVGLKRFYVELEKLQSLDNGIIYRPAKRKSDYVGNADISLIQSIITFSEQSHKILAPLQIRRV